jgi:hypothetical protein
LGPKIYEAVAFDIVVAVDVAIAVAVGIVGIVWGDHGYGWLMDEGYECDGSWIGERIVDVKRKCRDGWKPVQDWYCDGGLREEGAFALRSA